ncbi:MAG: DUF1294 domain-containing protein [Ruminococcus sp.]|nr:DUF1294 domain-containing protein [Ruminococcus sp.]
MEKYILIGAAAFFAVMSLIALILYKADKVKAEKKKWRIKEATLLGFGFFGGALGALAGMKLFRHKTKHWYFWAVNVAGLAWQAGLLAFLVIAFIRTL